MCVFLSSFLHNAIGVAVTFRTRNGICLWKQITGHLLLLQILGGRILLRKCKSVYAPVLANQLRSCLNIIYAVSPHQKTQKDNFPTSRAFSSFTHGQSQEEKPFFLCTVSLQCVNASFSWKMAMLYFHVFYFIMGKMAMLQICMPCSAALCIFNKE